jgi:hypothetical protein
MTKLPLRNIIFYLSVSAAMIIAVSQLGLWTTPVSAATCCTYGKECTGTTTCCLPYDQQANCSATKANFCRRVCGYIFPD